MEVTGTLQQGGKLLPVKGIGWMDHEFSTHSLPKKLVGWDWFSIQLDNRWELMIYQLRQRDGNPSPLSSGSLVDPKGEGIPLYLRDFQIEVLDHWKSPKSQGRYPIRWRLTLPREDIDLILTPLLKEQELLTPESTRVTYWEGAVAIQGTWQGRSITGRGYTEMTGYAGDLIHP
jgi:predicted secreted hydrolase